MISIIVWNCRGVGNPSFLRCAKNICRSHQPDIICLLETRASNDNIRTSPVKLGIQIITVFPPKDTPEEYGFFGKILICLFLFYILTLNIFLQDLYMMILTALLLSRMSSHIPLIKSCSGTTYYLQANASISLGLLSATSTTLLTCLRKEGVVIYLRDALSSPREWIIVTSSPWNHQGHGSLGKDRQQTLVIFECV